MRSFSLQEQTTLSRDKTSRFFCNKNPKGLARDAAS